jgi:hypothetical protein
VLLAAQWQLIIAGIIGIADASFRFENLAPGSPVTISVTTFGVRHIPIMTRIVTGDSGSLRNGKLRRRSLANSVFICFIIAKYLRLSNQNIFLFLATVGTGECRRLMKTSL